MTPHLTAIALGGAAGAVCRFGVNLLLVRAFGVHSSWGTLLVNLLGCLLAGLFLGAGVAAGSLRHSGVVVGFLGAFTTFSAFGLDCVMLAENRHYAAAAGYLVGNVAGGLGAAWAGIAAARALVG